MKTLNCMLLAGPPSLHYYCAVVLHSCIVLPPVGHSSNYQYHCCQLIRQSGCVSNFYRTFKVFLWLSLVLDFRVTYGTVGEISWVSHSVEEYYSPLFFFSYLSWEVGSFISALTGTEIKTLKHFAGGCSWDMIHGTQLSCITTALNMLVN